MASLRPERGGRRLTAALAVAAALTAGVAAAQRTAVVSPVSVEGPSALAHFHDALRALRRDPSRKVRVLHYGDSNVAADLWTAVVRETLQRRFGDGGSGYLLPRGHGSWHRGAVQVRATGRWSSRRRGHDGSADGLFGLAGVALEPSGPGAALRIEVPADLRNRTLELHLLGRPSHAGSVSVRVDGSLAERVPLARPEVGLMVRQWALDPAPHVATVAHAGGRPRVLGVVVERPAGVVYDVLGINGHRASAINHWDPALLRAQVARRPADLLILSYGGNEALDPSLSMRAYEADTRRAVASMREATPTASCLLVGPLASVRRHAPRMAQVSQIQRGLARELGCGFWDSAQTSGGPGTLERWIRFPGMVGGDHLHLGRQGYEQVGRAFVIALLQGLPREGR